MYMDGQTDRQTDRQAHPQGAPEPKESAEAKMAHTEESESGVGPRPRGHVTTIRHHSAKLSATMYLRYECIRVCTGESSRTIWH